MLGEWGMVLEVTISFPYFEERTNDGGQKSPVDSDMILNKELGPVVVQPWYCLLSESGIWLWSGLTPKPIHLQDT
jgi:hypothetical protein